MLTKNFIEFLYEAAHIQRWNDHIRPGGLLSWTNKLIK